MMGIYGGTFDPVHNGHIIIATEILNLTSLEKIVIMPTKTPPHKKESVSADFDQRLRWVRLAFNEIDRIEVSDFENKDKPSYTIDTVNFFEKSYGKIAYIMGEDSFTNIEKWYKYEDILRAVRLYVYPRYCDKTITNTLMEKFKNYDVHFLPLPIIEISSTKIRELATSGLLLRGYVPDKLEKEISEFYIKHDKSA